MKTQEFDTNKHVQIRTTEHEIKVLEKNIEDVEARLHKLGPRLSWTRILIDAKFAVVLTGSMLLLLWIHGDFAWRYVTFLIVGLVVLSSAIKDYVQTNMERRQLTRALQRHTLLLLDLTATSDDV